MSEVYSKNMYAALGNDPEYDEDRAPEPPTKVADKPLARQGKRDGPAEKKADAPTDGAARGGDRPRGRGRGGRGGFNDEERQFRDRTNRATYNRDHPIENTDGQVRGRDSGPGTQRVGRGPRGPRRGGDRHSRTGRTDDQKQIDHAWGGETGEAERADEIAADAIAREDTKEEKAEAADPTLADQAGELSLNDREPEPEDNSKSFAQYQAEQQAKRDAALGVKEARTANEGAKENKQWKNAQELSKTEGEAYFAGQEKHKRERERKDRAERVDIDFTFKEDRAAGGERGGRGRGRGGRGRGEGRGEFRGRGEGRGEYRGRGDRPARGDRESSFRGRGGRGQGAELAITEESFPSLGGK